MKNFKNSLNMYNSLDKDTIIKNVKEALRYTGLEYACIGDYEIMVNRDAFLKVVSRYIVKMDEMLFSDAHDMLLDYCVTNDNIYIRLRYK